MPFRFIHTADIHLDSPLKSLALRDTALSEAVGTATRAAFVRIIDLCLAEAVDALLIAGDLYDGAQTSMKTARFLLAQLARLEAAGVATWLIRGNHDAMSRITAELVFPPSVTVFGARAEVRMVETGGRPVAIHGISFARPQAPDSLLGKFRPPVPGAVNIGMMHTSLGGAAGHDVYAPCALADLQASGFDYWALGHVHVRAEYPGRCTVVMPGMPQGRDIGEAGAKSVTLVTVTDDGRVLTETRDTAAVRFERVPVAVDGLEGWPDLVAALGQAVRAARRDHAADQLVLRPMLTGRTPLAWRLLRDGDLMGNEAVAVAESLGSVWIDKLENLTEAGERAVVGDALADLAALIDPRDAGLVQAGAEVTDELLRALPRELRALPADLLRALPPGLAAVPGDDPDRIAAARADLMQAGAAEVLAALHGGRDADQPA
ncbi:DNA repair exonuclease [Paracoccaceae bacterium Fryx2]|nr:DNA repair exonuclease [Paracoccaceae bacterium Fryx2]